MDTVFVVMEKNQRGNRISKIFLDRREAEVYMYECRGSGEFYDFDSVYHYYVEEWEVDGQAV